MTTKQIFEYFDKMACVTFATLDGKGYIESRVAYFCTYDEDGLYFWTMSANSFYRQLMRTNKVSAYAMTPQTVKHNDSQRVLLEPGYTIYISGDVRELSKNQVRDKAQTKSGFYLATLGTENNPGARFFCLYAGRGEIFDYDYEKVNRTHKLLRRPFSFGGMTAVEPGLRIADTCIECGLCLEVCTFDAIEEGSPFVIDGTRCEECGNCCSVCPVKAIRHKEDTMHQDEAAALGQGKANLCQGKAAQGKANLAQGKVS
ncbi:MAG: 4Fe-4S binding protein [Peptococcaceae bacterium]|nr:4Fe-4S binding protein [Peptococcaceae bacterium]